MFCPKCSTQMGWYIDGLIRPGAGERICPSCGAVLEILNGNTGLLINGILFAAGLLVVWLRDLPYIWLWVALLSIGCWLLLPVWTKLFAVLEVSSYTNAQQEKARRLEAEYLVCKITMAAWVIYMAFSLIIPYGQIISELSSADAESWNKVEYLTQALKGRFASTRGLIEIAIGMLSFAWWQLNIARRTLFRRTVVADKLRQPDKMQNTGD
ncbi:MAG: TFIIB-type zinc ribbon-containing protein [Phycisphaerae bacterium]